MIHNQWAEVKALFEACLDLESTERAAYLADACADRPDVRAQVEKLLECDAQTTPFLEPIDAGAGAALVSQALEAHVKEPRMGNYRLLQTMGSGGMGTVYQAVRDDGEYDQRVAMKVIKPGMATDEIRQRFLHERQTLARLDHPNVARLLDGGTSSNGSPYIVLEFVEGIPVHEYCDNHCLGIEERLRLFCTVCSAVDYAHRNLVVHRDLKPANILVTKEGTPKLLDFGIAKIIAGDGSLDAATVTAASNRFLTPQYASPEQIRGESATTACDVYSLGVILYELLTGHRPYEIKNATEAEARRLICERAPDVPSTCVMRTTEASRSDGTTNRLTPESVSEARHTHPDKLRKRLRGDLDTIILTALHKEPARRYAGVQVMQDDIERYLNGFPVHARRDTMLYRAGKFVRRNKVAAVAGLLVLLSAVTGVAGVSVGLVRTTSALQYARRERDKANVEAQKARQISAFLQSVLAAADPYRRYKDVTVRQALDRAAARLETKLIDVPEIRASLHHMIGVTYKHLGNSVAAEAQLRSALALWSEVPAVVDADKAATLSQLGDTLRAKGQLVEAESLLRDAVSLLRSVDDSDEVETVGALGNLATLLQGSGQLAEAEQLYRDAWNLSVEELGTDDPRTLDAQNNLAASLAKQGRFADAQPLYESAIEIAEATLGVDNPRTLNYASNLGTLFFRRGQYELALPLFERLRDANAEAFGNEHPYTLTLSTNLAKVYKRLQRLAEAEELHRDVLRIRRDTLGDEHPQTVGSIINLAYLLADVDQSAEAAALFLEAIETGTKVFGGEHRDVLDSSSRLALLYHQQDRDGDALPLAVQAVDGYRETLGDAHATTLAARKTLASILCAMGRDTEGVAEYTGLLADADEHLPPKMWIVGEFRRSYAECLQQLGKLPESAEMMHSAYTRLRDALGLANPKTLRAGESLIGLYGRIGEAEKAREIEKAIGASRG